MQTIRYLAYGSNLLPARITARLGSCTTLGTIRLSGWQLCFHKIGADGSGKCNIVTAPASVAYGAVYELPLSHKQQLDTIEGVGKGYTDVTMILKDYGSAQVYLAEPSSIDEQLIPYDWYRAFVLSGATYHRFPASYLAEINAVETIRDPDDARRTENLSIQAQAST
jgi:hypothetical protein